MELVRIARGWPGLDVDPLKLLLLMDAQGRPWRELLGRFARSYPTSAEHAGKRGECPALWVLVGRTLYIHIAIVFVFLAHVRPADEGCGCRRDRRYWGRRGRWRKMRLEVGRSRGGWREGGLEYR